MAIYFDEKQTAIAFGGFAAIIHAVWSVLVWSGNAQNLINWIMGLHMVTTAVTVNAFNAVTALMLIVVTFVLGAVFGLIFAKVWNWAGKQKHI